MKKPTNLAFLLPPNTYWRNFAWIFLGFCVHTEILIDCQDENKKKEDEKEPYNSGWQWQSWNKKEVPITISEPAARKKFQSWNRKEKRDRIKKSYPADQIKKHYFTSTAKVCWIKYCHEENVKCHSPNTIKPPTEILQQQSTTMMDLWNLQILLTNFPSKPRSTMKKKTCCG